MNLSTHIVFGILVGALLFGRPEIALMVGIGAAINDLDREYGFFLARVLSTSTNTQGIISQFLVYRIVYLINPFLASAFSIHFWIHSQQQRQRRRVAIPLFKNGIQAVYNSDGKKLPLDPKHRIYFFQMTCLDLRKELQKTLSQAKHRCQ